MWTGKYCERCSKIGFEMCKCKKDTTIKELVEGHAETWADKPQWFWLVSLVEEVAELALSLVGLHKDPPELELAQIASIAINWRKHRLQINMTKKGMAFETEK